MMCEMDKLTSKLDTEDESAGFVAVITHHDRILLDGSYYSVEMVRIALNQLYAKLAVPNYMLMPRKPTEAMTNVLKEMLTNCHSVEESYSDLLTAAQQECPNYTAKPVVTKSMVKAAMDVYTAGHIECCYRHMKAAIEAAKAAEYSND